MSKHIKRDVLALRPGDTILLSSVSGFADGMEYDKFVSYGNYKIVTENGCYDLKGYPSDDATVVVLVDESKEITKISDLIRKKLQTIVVLGDGAGMEISLEKKETNLTLTITGDMHAMAAMMRKLFAES